MSTTPLFSIAVQVYLSGQTAIFQLNFVHPQSARADKMSTNAGVRRQPSYPQVRACEGERVLMMYIGRARRERVIVYLWPISGPSQLTAPRDSGDRGASLQYTKASCITVFRYVTADSTMRTGVRDVNRSRTIYTRIPPSLHSSTFRRSSTRVSRRISRYCQPIIKHAKS